MNAAVYVHIPFCVQKCAYCDFASYAGRKDEIDEYLSALITEIQSARDTYGVLGVPTVYIGGGTPSLLSVSQLARLMTALSSAFSIWPGAEISMEANPGTVTLDTLAGYRASGVNRLSFGAQAYQSALLKTLGRIHKWDDVIKAVRFARKAGFSNINLDLMYALPGQTVEMWRETLAQALALCPQHLSMYSLIVEPGTPLHALLNAGALTLPEEDELLRMDAVTAECARAAGYERYEISNYARKGYPCRHNIVYWTRGNYLGLGCAAHSLMGDTRFANPASIDAYLNGARRTEMQILPIQEQKLETVMLETRMTRGLDLDRYRRLFGEDIAMLRQKEIQTLTAQGLIRVAGGYLSLTDDGLNVQNAIVRMLTD